MNDVDHFTLSSSANALAPIYLGSATLHCTVIGHNINDTVLDEGTGNILTNVRRGHRPHSAVGFSSQVRTRIMQFLPKGLDKWLK